jgi:predicted ArsR family transcriptional regulator
MLAGMDASPAAERLLGLIKRRGPQRVADLAGSLGVTAEAARQKLMRLAGDGLVEAEETGAEKTGAEKTAGEEPRAGRPSRRWRLTAAGEARFPDTHGELTVQLIATIRRELGEEALQRVIAARGAEIRRAYHAALDGIQDIAGRVARLTEIRSSEGYMAECRAENGALLLLENHCPVCAAATACQGFCRAELAIFRDVLGPDAAVERLEHIPDGARRCAYRISERKGADA